MTGPNGVGKSSLIEALWLFHGRYNPSLLWNLHIQRRPSIEGQRFDPLAFLGNGRPIELRGMEDGASFGVKFDYDEVVQPLQNLPNGQSRPRSGGVEEEFGPGLGGVSQQEFNLFPVLGSLRAEYESDSGKELYQSDVMLTPAGQVFARPMPVPTKRASGIIVSRDAPFPIRSETVEQFSNVVARGQKRQLLKILRLIRPHIRDIEILSHQGSPSLWADVRGSGLLPVEAVGGGVVRLLGLFVYFLNAKGGVIIIDEIENGIHFSALQSIWQQIHYLSGMLNVQSFITTHSLECVRAAVSAGTNGRGSTGFVVHQMYQTKNGERRSETYSGDKLSSALDLGFDIR